MSQYPAENDLPLISVIIPVYNRESFICRALESVFSQSYPAGRMDVIVIDDGSTDNTSDIVKQYGRDIRYIRQENRGIASARNKGIAAAKGEVISFLDADDLWHKERLQKIAGVFNANMEIGMVYHSFSLIDGGDEIIHDNFYKAFGYTEGLSGRVSKEIFSGRIFCGGSSFAFTRKIIDKIYPVPEDVRRGVDYYIASISSCLADAVFMPGILGKYRYHGMNTTMHAGRDDIKKLAAVNNDFAHMRSRLIGKIAELGDSGGAVSAMDIVKRRRAQEEIFYHILRGERTEGIRLTPSLFTGNPGLNDLGRGLVVCLAALFIPAGLYPKLMNLHEMVKTRKF